MFGVDGWGLQSGGASGFKQYVGSGVTQGGVRGQVAGSRAVEQVGRVEVAATVTAGAAVSSVLAFPTAYAVSRSDLAGVATPCLWFVDMGAMVF